jgi:hypothetical protein
LIAWVVAQAHQGRGFFVARLYDDLFAFAREPKFSSVTCEFDIEPPNEARAFPRTLRLRRSRDAGAAGGKRVSLQRADVRRDTPVVFRPLHSPPLDPPDPPHALPSLPPP